MVNVAATLQKHYDSVLATSNNDVVTMSETEVANTLIFNFQ